MLPLRSQMTGFQKPYYGCTFAGFQLGGQKLDKIYRINKIM